ncbi:MAG: ABC transporter substrate-binding protein [Trueperaceae bacterium]|nr:MAG: ABC transporter substrate-binding protein [Trueperaceae bacterium]
MNFSGRFSLLVAMLAALFMLTLSATAQEMSCEEYHEAPELAALVAAGELPPIAERLPVHPRVVEPANEIGQYGGEFLSLYGGGRLAEFRQFGYENLVRWSADGSEVIPNIAESWEINDDATTYTFHLREGLKWSDGHPFTTADISFWWEEVETAQDINPGGARSFFYIEGELATLNVIDDLTFSFSWSSPNGLFLQNLSTSYGVRVTQFARHYLEQFDPDYNPDGVAEMMAEAGESNFGLWWESRVGTYGDNAEYNDPNRPLMHPWIPTEPFIGKERFTFVRNPYYFKVDTACNQLPYIGERSWRLAPDAEVQLLQTLNGEQMFSTREISQPPNRAVFFDNQETGNYRFINAVNSDFNTMELKPNYSHSDPVQAEIFLNKDFRIGLSLAMDRQTVIDTVYIGQGIPHQQAPRPESPFYNERLATQYTEYDLEQANAHLDMVMPDRDADGYRLRPDGERFTFTVVVNQDFRPDWVDVMQLVQRNWVEAGIDARLDVVSDDLYDLRREDPATDATVWAGENGTGQLPMLSVAAKHGGGYIPEGAAAWWAWFDRQLDPNAETEVDPVTPPATIQRQFEILSKLPTTVGDEQIALMNEHLELAAEGFYTIGLSLPMGDYRVVSNNLGNVPESVITGWLYPGPSPVNFETFYILDGN